MPFFRGVADTPAERVDLQKVELGAWSWLGGLANSFTQRKEGKEKEESDRSSVVPWDHFAPLHPFPLLRESKKEEILFNKHPSSPLYPKQMRCATQRITLSPLLLFWLCHYQSRPRSGRP
ncbi:alpha-D-phosphohexomutase family protein [Striga asiatica]|uniref:Alpha-D-phosphohexomutase family protein n=1 Tax=Striga asiatica TaxID=4170 RepID=A0A5A7R050_STRAF|nr:alpha-D-phosphohexomutase family protein [Striga asiatica]